MADGEARRCAQALEIEVLSIGHFGKRGREAWPTAIWIPEPGRASPDLTSRVRPETSQSGWSN